ncbi:MAG: hypothetical protein ACFFDS_03725, partial [Candidatus Thorarchaeota archaeon]
MNINKENVILEPGKTIEYIEGEILTVRISKWGIFGKLKIKNQVYNYSIKDLEFSKNIIIGLDLIIEKGFCIKNKKEEIVITDGKFGKANIKFNLNRYYNEIAKQKSTLTGIVKLIYNYDNDIVLEIERFIPPYHSERCVVLSKDKERLKKKFEGGVGKIVRILGQLKETFFIVETFDILPENHFWYKFVEIRDHHPDKIDNFSQIITQQMELIDNLYESFRKITFNFWKDVSKSSLVNLKELLYSKIFSEELKTPYNILIPKS